MDIQNKTLEEHNQALADIIVDGFLEIRELINEAQGLGKWPRPIPVSERLPENADLVLLHFYFTDTFIGIEHSCWGTGHYEHDGQWYSDVKCEDRIEEEITHWLPMPPSIKR